MLGHHLDDQIETVLFRILRGTGMKGLSGMKRQSELGTKTILRPLINLEKKEIIFPVYLPDVFCNSNWSLFDDIKAISTPEKKAANNKVTIASRYIIYN